MPRWIALVTSLALLLALSGCSVRRYAIRQIGSALSAGAAGSFAAESDPAFAGQAVPFSLKLIETLLWEQPDNEELLLAASAGFTQYAFVWVQQPADFIEATDWQRARSERLRARAFFLRANDYALRALELRHPGIGQRLNREPAQAVQQLRTTDVAPMYWAATSLGGAIALGKTEPALVARLDSLGALIDRAYALDPDWGEGALRELLMSYELARPGAGVEGARRARALFERIVADTQGLHAAPFVTFAEAVSVQQQDRAEFRQLLERALAIDTTRTPQRTLSNVVMQQRARWLLDRIDELFLD